MANPESPFDLELHQTYVRTLTEEGFAVFTSIEHGADGQTTCSAWVVPRQEYEEGLRILNRPSGQVLEGRSGAIVAMLAEDLGPDPRLCTSDSAWQALVDSVEAATRLQDNAPAGSYFAFDETFESYVDRINSAGHPGTMVLVGIGHHVEATRRVIVTAD